MNGLLLAAAGSAILNWTPPTHNTDGSLLTDLASYRVSYGCEVSGQYDQQESFTGGSPYTVEDLPDEGTCYFVLQAVNSAGTPSEFSEEASKVMGPISPPGKPTIEVAWREAPDMAFAFESSVTNTASSGTTIDLVMTAAVGDVIFVAAGTVDDLEITSNDNVSDNVGNTWVSVRDFVQSANGDATVDLYATTVTNANPTVTYTFDAAIAFHTTYFMGLVFSTSGVDSLDPPNQEATGVADSSSSASASLSAPTEDDGLIISSFFDEGTGTITETGAGLTEVLNGRMAMGYKIQTTAQAETVTWNGAGFNAKAILAAAFIESGGAVATSFPPSRNRKLDALLIR